LTRFDHRIKDWIVFEHPSVSFPPGLLGIMGSFEQRFYGTHLLF
jgi:hypothetical protein